MSVSPADREFVRASDGLLFTFLSASLSASLSADAVVGFGLLELATGCDFACLVLLDMIKFAKKTNLINVKFEILQLNFLVSNILRELENLWGITKEGVNTKLKK